ncbi:MAG: sigma-70 family RNA polymerase sigma factor [Synergistetes bacterium]|nr:sigma-70 family RNA polymerase sigma factor [Synergistota bacterium]MDW8191756.1 sigma-70 family RNA polymerase sigma factor [Synergistota bacterium]
MSLEELVLAVQSGQTSFLVEIVERFRPLVESLARRYSLKGGSYEDLRQEGYLILIGLVYRYRKGTVRLEGYVKGSLEMHLKSYWLRELNWNKGVILNDDLSFEESSLVEDVDLPVSSEDKSLLELYYLWGYNDKQISERLNKSRSWVNLRRRRIVDKLKREFSSNFSLRRDEVVSNGA